MVQKGCSVAGEGGGRSYTELRQEGKMVLPMFGVERVWGVGS